MYNIHHPLHSFVLRWYWIHKHRHKFLIREFIHDSVKPVCKTVKLLQLKWSFLISLVQIRILELKWNYFNLIINHFYITIIILLSHSVKYITTFLFNLLYITRRSIIKNLLSTLFKILNRFPIKFRIYSKQKHKWVIFTSELLP